MLNMVKRLVREEEGQGMAEYGLILALIAVVVIGALTGIGQNFSPNLRKLIQPYSKMNSPQSKNMGNLFYRNPISA